MNLSPLSIFSLLAQILIISEIDILPLKLSKNFLLIHLLTKSSIFLKKLTFLTSCNYVLLCFNGHTNRFTDSINLDFLKSFSKLAYYVKWYFYSRLDAICPIEVERL